MWKRMHDSKVDKNPRENAGLCSRALLSWMNPLLKTGYQRPLNNDDLYELSNEDQAKHIAKKMNKAWKREIRTANESNRPPQLWKALLYVNSWQVYVLSLLMKCTRTAGYVGVAVFLYYLLAALNDSGSVDIYYKVLVASGLILSILTSIFASWVHNDLAFKAGMRLKIALIQIVYKELLKMKRFTLSQAKVGRIQNMISADVGLLEEAISKLPPFLTVPLDLVVFLTTMILLIGCYSVFGVAVIFLPLMATSIGARIFNSIQFKKSLLTDKRLAIVHEIISGIRAVKAFAYEDNYMDAVDNVRRKETRQIFLKSIFFAINSTLRATLDAISGLVAITVMIYMGIKLGASAIFTLTNLLSNINQNTIVLNFDNSFRLLQETFVAVKRIEKFLCECHSFRKPDDVVSAFDIADFSKDGKDTDIVNKEEIYKTLQEECNKYGTLTLNHFSASWNTDEGNILHNININTQPNELIIVTGQVGSGKSSLLMAIQGEIPATSGTLSAKGHIAYVPQIPWIFSGTVRDNITFGKPYDENKYLRILDVCELQQDIQRFPKGDQSMIGQRGVMLSGGQRARVSLARAVYSDADIFLMDDPLSAVDVKVGQRIFEKCICEELSGRLRVVVTHQLQYLNAADRIITMRNGGIEFQGSYEELKQTDVINHGGFDDSCKDTTNMDAIREDDIPFEKRQDIEDANDLSASKEDRAVGHVTWQTYWSFFRTGPYAIVLVMFMIFYFVAQGAIVSPNLFQAKLAHMSQDEQESPATTGIYCGLVFGAVLFCSIRSYLSYFFVVRSARKLHPKLTESVIKSPVLFFDTNPLGRIMNRFSSDISNLEDKMPRQFEYAFSFLVQGIGVLILAFYASLWFIFAAIPLVFIMYYYGRYLLRISREISRLESISRSSVFEHVSETERGLEVIRSSQMESEFTAKMIRCLDEYTKAIFIRLSLCRWFALRSNLTCSLLVIAIIVIGITGTVEEALTGTLLTITLAAINLVQYGIRMACDVENSMTSAERVLAYSSLPPEPGYSIQSKPPESWPDHGLVSLHNVSLQYVDNGVMVLENLNLEVQPKEKIGIVGRTGAGKSSLFAAILRMPEPRGQIMIDGVDLAHINIQLARRSMAVISQDPFLFAGTLKRNLDPFDRFTDDEIWTALTHVQLSSKIATLHDQLDCAVGTSGTGFSVGERQLLCLARALLQKSRILLMDEATANVDYKTDQLIQQTIRDKFIDCTVLTIAHRLNTIMDYDRVVVMDQGHVVEQGEPAVLAGKGDGYFNNMMNC